MASSPRLDSLLRTLDLQPLTARSVVISALLGAGSRGLRVAVLVYLSGAFGISAGAARVALSRMLSVGEVELSSGRYRLVGRLLDRQTAQDSSRRPAIREWDGSWSLMLSPKPLPAKAVPALRDALGHMRYAEFSDGMWMRPTNLVQSPSNPVQALLSDHFEQFSAQPHMPGRQLAARLWDLSSWAVRARALRQAMVHMGDELAHLRAEALAPGFMVSAAVLRHIAQDPLLPPALLPDDWPGVSLRSEFEQHDAQWQELLAEISRVRAVA